MAKKASSKPDAETSSDTAPVTVRVLVAALGENETTYFQGDTFTTTTARAAALGDAVQVV